MKIQSIRTNYGASVFHSRPTLVMTIDLEDWNEISSTDRPHFNSNLLKILPSLDQHTCSPGYVGGFVERLNRGTYMAHIIEHVALELSGLAGEDISFGKTRYAGRAGLYEVIVRFSNEAGMKECLRQAVKLVQAAMNQESFLLNEVLENIKEIISDSSLGPSGQALLDAARKRGIPARRIGQDSLIQLGYGKNTKRVQAAVSEQTSLIAVEIAQDKYLTKQLLEESFIPVPQGSLVSTLEELKAATEEIDPPYAIKPYDGNHGKGVALNLKTWDEVSKAFEYAQNYSRKVLIEEMCAGRDYRVLVINGKVAAAAERVPPFVLGDGQKTVAELIEILNTDARRGEGHMNVLSKVEVDEITLCKLQKQNKTLNSIPQINEKVILRENANLSSGGTATDVTDIIHPEVALMCERAARVIGLDICGLDVIHADISLPLSEGAKIIEVNAGPGLRMHLSPSEGKARPVAEQIIDMLYPQPEAARIPIIAVTGTNGKTTTVRMIHKILTETRKCCVGLTTTDGIWIGNKKVYTGDTTGPKSSQLILSDPSINAAVLEVARGGLLRGGVSYDWSDVAVVTNISADHIGQNGIDDLEDLLWIKSLVAERVKENGTVVLNADDELTLSIRENPRVIRQNPKYFLLSKSATNENIKSHVAAGGSACWLEAGWIMQSHQGVVRPIVRAATIPVTMNGMAEFQIYNIMASIASCTAIGTNAKLAANVLENFQAAQENIGRFNIYKLRDSYVVLDYAHNFEALSSVGKLMQQFQGYKKTAVVGLPGDRSEVLLKDTAQEMYPYYDEFILKDDKNLRGRAPNEIPVFIGDVFLGLSKTKKHRIVTNELDAVQTALEQAQPKEIIVIFYDDLKDVQSLLLQYDPEPVSTIPLLGPAARKKTNDITSPKSDYVHTL